MIRRRKNICTRNNRVATDSAANWFEAGSPVEPLDFRPVGTSSAIDAGLDTVPVFDDYDGELRPIDGDSSGVNGVDIGAFEFRPEG